MEAEPIVHQATIARVTAVQSVPALLEILAILWYLVKEESVRDLKTAQLMRLATLTIARYQKYHQSSTKCGIKILLCIARIF